MIYNHKIISALQANKILAQKLDEALRGVEQALSNQLDMIGAGATRALYYTSCFTEEYQDVCKKQANEDVRFSKAVYKVLRNEDVIFEIFKIYYEVVFRHKTEREIRNIQKYLMMLSSRISTNTLTSTAFSFASVAILRLGASMTLERSLLVGSKGGVVPALSGTYGIIQKAADSADRLKWKFPAFYTALYMQEIEMLFFLVEERFNLAGALNMQFLKDHEIAQILNRLLT